jgi:anti-anti-sigma factor
MGATNRIRPRSSAYASASDGNATSHPVRVYIEAGGDVARVCPAGDLDLGSVGAVRKRIDAMAAAGFSRVVLDLRELTFLDATGLRLAFETQARARDDGWDFALIEGPAVVQRVFDITRARSQLPFLDGPQIP